MVQVCCSIIFAVTIYRLSSNSESCITHWQVIPGFCVDEGDVSIDNAFTTLLRRVFGHLFLKASAKSITRATSQFACAAKRSLADDGSAVVVDISSVILSLQARERSCAAASGPSLELTKPFTTLPPRQMVYPARKSTQPLLLSTAKCPNGAHTLHWKMAQSSSTNLAFLWMTPC